MGLSLSIFVYYKWEYIINETPGPTGTRTVNSSRLNCLKLNKYLTLSGVLEWCQCNIYHQRPVWYSEGAVQYFCYSSGCALQDWDSCSRNFSEPFGSWLHMFLSQMGQRLFLHSTFFLVPISDLESLQLLIFLGLDYLHQIGLPDLLFFLLLISH